MPSREVLAAPGMFVHENPIPTAIKMGQFVFSSALPGVEPDTQEIPEDPARQITLAFDQVRRTMEAAGGSPADIAKVTIFLQDLQYRSLVNEEWVKMFPNTADRPVRHAIRLDLPRGYIIQIEIMAMLSA
jgi:enamine deaminase RidA (YjgF/YER057c/UK114 family)